MITFTDGPAAGQTLSLRRAPLLLRVVRSAAGKWDGLDLLDDEPRAGEVVFVYRRQGQAGTIHIDSRGKDGRRRGDWYAWAEYAMVPEQPGPLVTRDTARWQEWCRETHARTNPPPAPPPRTDEPGGV